MLKLKTIHDYNGSPELVDLDDEMRRIARMMRTIMSMKMPTTMIPWKAELMFQVMKRNIVLCNRFFFVQHPHV